MNGSLLRGTLQIRILPGSPLNSQRICLTRLGLNSRANSNAFPLGDPRETQRAAHHTPELCHCHSRSIASVRFLGNFPC